MATDFGKLLDTLGFDPWRTGVGFTDDVTPANERLFAASNHADAKCVIQQWVAQHQPCLFGRLAARSDLIHFCILTEDELRGDETTLRDKIQEARTEWLALGYEGKKSAFVILVISPLIAHAIPSAAMQAIAQGLCELYLLCEIAPDKIYLDEMFLEKPGTMRTTWKWLAGVNYFCAQGDKRWWHDHRIPGGMAFSVNSVGHLVKSGQLSQALEHLDAVLGGPSQSPGTEPVTSLGKALDLAMRTIGLAADSVSGKATLLLPLPDPTPPDMPSCPVALPKLLQGKDYTTYRGWYHTDVTVPSVYFRPDVERPADVEANHLDFTYLFHDDIENPDHLTTAKGRRVRTDTAAALNPRLARMVAESVATKDQSLLQYALAPARDR